MGMEMRLLHPLGLGGIAIEQLLDEGAHPLVDQVEQAGGGRVEAIIEIENPVGDLAEQRDEARIHGARASSPPNRFSKMKAFGRHSGKRGKAVEFQWLDGEL